MLQMWSTGEQTVRIVAFLNIRALAINIPYPFIETCLKGIYLTYVRNSKFTNAKTISLITFLSNCVIELYGLDFVSSYQHAFVYIRQLAIHLRQCLQNPTRKTMDTVLSWQFFNSLRVWVKLLVAYPDEEELKPLRYPVIQIVTGLIRFSSLYINTKTNFFFKIFPIEI